MTDSQGRKWQLTWNNPLDHGNTHERIIERFSELAIDYWCLADEVGTKTKTHHTHGFIYSPSPVRFSRLKRLFPQAHIEKANGSCKDNRDYILKEGRWRDTLRAETSIEGSFCENGEMPNERQPKEDKRELLYAMVEQGLTTEEIIEIDKSFVYRIKTIDDLVQRRLAAQYRNINRPVEVIYVWGATGTSKTRSIHERHRDEGLCRITSYRNGCVNFDSYHSDPVLVFEEFNSQIPIEAMLNYLDIYPVMLPARYADKVGCFTKVYLTSNIPLEKQYPDVQRKRPEMWKAFLRRIHKVVHHSSNGTTEEIIMKGSNHARPQQLF